MTRISDEFSEKLVFWSFVLTVGIVVIHCGWRAETAWGRLTIALFRDTLARMGVPFFFACSGGFLARHFDEPGWWRQEIGKRVVSLMVPYFLWTLAYAAMLYAEAHEVMGIGGFGVNPCTMPALAALWFVRCLMLFAVLAPLFKRALDIGRHWTLVIAYVLMLAFASAMNMGLVSDDGRVGGFLYYGFSLEGLFYFLLGMYVRRQWRAELPRAVCRVAFGLGLGLIVLRLWTIHRGIATGIDLRCVITPLMLIGILDGFALPPLPAFLRGCSFPIFLMHGLVLDILRYWGGVYHRCNPWLELVLGVTVPVLFCQLVKRVAPRVASVLFGGRV